MTTFKINADVRAKDEVVKKLKNDSQLAGVIYGKKQEPISIKMDYSEFLKLFRLAGESQIISIKVGKKDIEVLVHQIQREPISGDFIHIDFYALTRGEVLTTNIALSFIGDSAVIKEGGIIQEQIKEIEVKCLPRDLVESFEVDLSKIKNIGDTITIADLGINREVYDMYLNDEDVIVMASIVKQEVIEDEAAAVQGEEGEEGTEGESSDEKSEEK